MKAPFLRTAHNYDMDKESQLTGLYCPEVTLTQQQFKEDTDINTIVRRFGLTGELPNNPQPPVYADYEGVFDFQTAQHVIIDANARFMAFPAELRARFANDPQRMLEFVANEGNREEAERLGLLKPKPMPVPDPVEPKGKPADSKPA